MSTLTVGRISFSVEEGLDIGQSGDELTLAGETIFENVAQAAVFAVQLNGYADSPDENVVPVIYEEMPDLTGFYRLRDIKVDRPVDTSFEGLFPFRLSLERVRQSAAPLQQITHQGQSRVVAGSWNLLPNSSGESGVTGLGLYAGTSGTSARTNPTSTTLYGSKVLRSTWSVASSAAGGGVYQEAAATEGFRYSVGVNHVKSSIGNRLALRLRFLNEFDIEISGTSATAVQVTAGTTYTADDFKVESAVAPVGTVKLQVQITSVSGTGYANWSIGSYLETDGWVACVGSVLVGKGVTAWNAAQRNPYLSLSVPASANSLVAVERRTDAITTPILTPEPVDDGEAVVGFKLDYNELTASFYCPAEHHYEGAVDLRVNEITGVWEVITGRQMENQPGNWLLGNGKFEIRRAYPEDVPLEGAFALSYRRFISGGAWDSWQTVVLGRSNIATGRGSDADSLKVPEVITILRNTPEAVTIRLMSAYENTDGSLVPTTADITLRRGDGYASIELASVVSTYFLVEFTPDLTGGYSFASAVPGPYHIRDSATKRFLASPEPLQYTSTDNEYFHSNQSKRWSIGLGFCEDYQSSASPEPRFEQFEYLWGGSESQSVSLL